MCCQFYHQRHPFAALVPMIFAVQQFIEGLIWLNVYNVLWWYKLPVTLLYGLGTVGVALVSSNLPPFSAVSFIFILNILLGA